MAEPTATSDAARRPAPPELVERVDEVRKRTKTAVKTIVIDRRIAFTGGMNIARE